MRLHTKQETEPIATTLDRYRTELPEHPLLVAAWTGQIGRPTLLRFAYYHFASRRLRTAIEDYIAHVLAATLDDDVPRRVAPLPGSADRATAAALAG